MAAGMWTKTGMVHSFCGAVLFCLIILLGCSAGNPCPSKLQFNSSIRGCLNCSLCNNETNPQEYKDHQWEECKKKNPKPIHNGDYLWCSNSRGPYPTCKEPESLQVHVLNCSHGRVFNASVSCNIQCGNEIIKITCSENITWVPLPDPKTCRPPPTTETSVTQESTPPNVVPPESGIYIIIAVAAVVVTIAVLVGVCLVLLGFYLRSRRNRMSNSHNRSSSQSTCSQTGSVTESMEGAGEESKTLLESGCDPTGGAVPGKVGILSLPGCQKEVGMKPSADANRLIQTQEVQQKSTLGPLKMNGYIRKTTYDDNSSPVVCLAPENVSKATDVRQQRTTDMPRADMWQCHVGNMQEVTMSHQPFEGNVTDEDSQIALKDFLNDRKTALLFCHFFDQKDGFCKVTWHNIANGLLQKTHDEIKAFEYRSLPTPGDQLSGMPTFHILGEAYQRGLGLLELRMFLESELKDKPDADSAKKGIKLLNDFLSKWLAKKQTTAVPNTRV